MLIWLELIALTVSIPAASSLDLIAPDGMNVSGEESCEIRFAPAADASKLSACLTVPEGLSDRGDAKIKLGNKKSSCKSSHNGKMILWDLSGSIKSCRHIVINEMDQNPAGTDSKKEWIELYNPSSESIDIGRWRLSNSYSAKTVSIPEGTVIQPGGYQLLNWTNGTLINSAPVSISLLDASGRVVDRTIAAKDSKNNKLCWARYANGKDLDRDDDWVFQESTPGSSNGGAESEIYSGELLGISFNLTADCKASGPAQLYLDLLSSNGKTSASSQLMDIGRANLSISIMPDKFDINKGDEVTWTVLLENDGNGTANDIVVNTSISKGLKLLSAVPAGSNWRISDLKEGQKTEIRLSARAVSTMKSYSCTTSAHWGPGPCQEVSQTSNLDARTAISKLPDGLSSITIGQTASFQIFADLPKGGRNLWINDTIPFGLEYNKSSLAVQGLMLQREMMTENDDGSCQICWFFGDAKAGEQIEITYNGLLENNAGNQDPTMLPKSRAAMSWMLNGECKTDSDESGPIEIVEPDLILDLQSSRPFAAPDDKITFTLALNHSTRSHAAAYDLELQATLPASLTYDEGSAEALDGASAAFDSNSLIWKIDSLSWDKNQSQKIRLRFNTTCHALPGQDIKGKARLKWSSLPGECRAERTGAGGINDYLCEAASRSTAMSLAIKKVAEPNPAVVGEKLAYTISYESQGSVAHNVTITDTLDAGVSFLSSDPEPSANETGRITWTFPRLEPDGAHCIELLVAVKGDLPDGYLLQNRFSINCDELDSKSSHIFTPVRNATRLSVNKTALKKAVRRGEDLDYIITVCNLGGQMATNITVLDVFDTAIEITSVWPELSGDGSWHFLALAPGQCLQMGLTARIPKTDVTYLSSGNVSGRGFVRAFRDYSTSRTAAPLINRVYVSSDQMHTSASEKVQILAEDGTELSVREHGSGDYECREKLQFLTANKSIQMIRDMKAEHHSVQLPLPDNSPQQSVSSLWNEEVRAKNGVTNTTLEDSHRQSSRLEENSILYLDENQSKIKMQSAFQGMAHTGVLKHKSGQANSREDAFLIEDYAGTFQIDESVEDMGQNLMMVRSASGQGYASKDAKDASQRSYESGTGNYRSEEMMDSISGFMKKDMQVEHQSISLQATPYTCLNMSRKWSEGMISRTKNSLISEEFTSAQRLKLWAVASSLAERESEAAFSGTATLQTSYKEMSEKNQSLAMERDETFMGDYEIKRKMILGGISRYNYPHLYLRKDGQRHKDIASFVITIENDGNSAIGPLYLRDIFPPGARFVNSTLQPTQKDQNCSNWTLLHLAIGNTLRIGINLDIERCSGDIVNRATVIGNCSAGQVIAENISIIDKDYLGCCPPTESFSNYVDNNYVDNNQGIGCACWQDETDNQSDFLDPIQLKTQWNSADEAEEGSCPLSCPALLESYASVTPNVP
jgi:uncharacterized repeat protein (TIGR01451 family)